LHTESGTQARETGESAQALVRYLREHPEAVRVPAKELAEQFGLSVEFVERFIAGLVQRKGAAIDARPVISPVRRFLGRTRRLVFRLMDHPVPFISVTAAAAISLFLYFHFLNHPLSQVRPGDPVIDLRADPVLFFGITLATLLLHWTCYYRLGRVRYALLGAVACWVLSATALMVVAWLRMQDQNVSNMPVQLLLLAFGMLALNVAYAGAGAFAAVLGGFAQLKRSDRELEQMTRQQLLGRLFELQELLEKPHETLTSIEERPWYRALETVRAQPLHYAIGLGAGAAAVYMLLRGVVFGHLDDASLSRMPLLVLVTLAFQVSDIALMAIVSFVHRNVGGAILSAVVYQLSGLLMYLLPIPHFGPEFFRRPAMPFILAIGFILAVTVGIVAHVGSLVEERALRERRRLVNDPAILLAELVRIQWMLSVKPLDVCVMVVDVVKSSLMKAGSDPLKAEFSFRDYQEMVAGIAQKHGGRVHSTAGDGVVVAFDDCRAALDAAKSVQSEMPLFNQSRNRLSMPFRLRIGIHSGLVTGDIDKVVFTEVIDIAAHSEKRAPVGGIVVTEKALERLTGEPMAPLNEEIGGNRLFLVLSSGSS